MRKGAYGLFKLLNISYKKIMEFIEEMLKEQYRIETAKKIINGYLTKRKTTLRINTIKSNIEEIKNKLQESKIEYEEVPWSKEALIIKNVDEKTIQEMDIYQDGKIYMQSLSSMLPPIILEPKEKTDILDMAAAPGGKTTQIAALTKNKAHITACEKNKIRAERLKYNLQKQGIGSVNVMIEDARKLSDFFSFDKILLDAPCSGSGTTSVFDKNFSKELVERSARVQEELLRKALKILKPDGEMVYSTCSILTQENEEILKKVLTKTNSEIVPIKTMAGIPTLPVNIEGTVCVCPTELYEGFFVAKIRKR